MGYNVSMDKLFLEKIIEADSICIFSHHYPDGDCVGSQMGLKKTILENFPDKKVYAVGEHSARWQKVFGPVDDVDDKTLTNSLAIIVDHNAYHRCGDQRVHQCHNGIRFDHHILGKDPYPFPALVDEDAVSASQVILEFLLRVGLKIPKTAIEDFAIAFCDDKRQYTKHNVPKRAEEIEKLLSELGADLEKADEIVHAKEEAQIAYEAKIKERAILEDDIIFAIMRGEDYIGLGYPYPDAGSKSDYLLSLSSARVAILFTYSHFEIRMSARSRDGFSVQALCSHFGGGGHLQAAGATLPLSFPIEEVIETAKKMLHGE